MADTIISLSTIPPRLPHLAPVLESLLAQNLPAAQVALWIPRRYRRFPDWDGSLPALPPGIRIARCDEDLGPATKILPALREHQGQQVEILFCDDDNIYPADWHRAFVAVRAERPRALIAAQGGMGPGGQLRDTRPRIAPGDRRPRMVPWRQADLPGHIASLPPPLPLALPVTRRSGYAHHFLGRGGAMVRPGFFGSGVFDIPPLLWGHDDLWLSAQAEVNGTGIWCDARIPNPVNQPCLRMIRPLLHATIDGRDRQTMTFDGVGYLRDRYGIWPTLPDGGASDVDGDDA